MKATSPPFISVVIPARNEEHHIASCLRCVLEGTYPIERLEILVVDGKSSDRTREIVLEFSKRHSVVRLLDNPARVVPHAMNIGIRAARGEIILRMDAHARYSADYVMTLVNWMERLDADNVGGVWVVQPASNSLHARAVALVTSHSFGVGPALYRLNRLESPIEVDTVPFGCYRRDIFDRIGFYDEMFIRNQDDEFNARLKKSGGKIFLVPEIRIDYVARDTLAKMARMLYQYGYFKPLVAIKLGRLATLRQLVPPAFVAALLILPILALAVPWFAWLWVIALAMHSVVNLSVSGWLATYQDLRLFPYLFFGFILAHFAYGLGYLKGLVDFGLLRRHPKNSASEISLTR